MSHYTIDKQQQQQFLTNGYIRLDNALPAKLLNRWQQLAQQLESEAMNAHHQGQPLHGACVVEDPVGPRVMRVDDIFAIDPDAALDLLACPAMMAVARELCGRGAVPLQLDILYKQQHPHPVIKWHQGAPHSRKYPYLNIGIYLDDAPEGDGCLRYVPGTQHELLDIEDISRQHGWEVPGVVELPAKAGDILIQDMMILHGSQPKRSPGVRRTIYVEYRPFDGIIESGIQSEAWAELRRRWMAQVLQRATSENWPQEWHTDYPAKPGSLEALAGEMIANREPPIPAVWGNLPIETQDYPVPEDMKNW
ncbi:phytanoyl-CoA dioxygenase family protein [Marinobacterium arenosum]|uniref:phytanoyl-CoA dioxygenase family protein n=1 Tax=Marinobacterium arenosum TaxID=2862496 RepID=UPI001C9446DC|nr:phytanoyl-CoA dioxygenase family protein [Marinobacterium arenosum]MBY4677670.1 phytanoyl-CoA dioxygenase family protein [Marinobacterium arenosum]